MLTEMKTDEWQMCKTFCTLWSIKRKKFNISLILAIVMANILFYFLKIHRFMYFAYGRHLYLGFILFFKIQCRKKFLTAYAFKVIIISEYIIYITMTNCAYHRMNCDNKQYRKSFDGWIKKVIAYTCIYIY